MLSNFTRIVWACAAVGLTVTLVSYAFGLVPRSSSAGNSTQDSPSSPTAVIAAGETASPSVVQGAASPDVSASPSSTPIVLASPTLAATPTAPVATLTADQLAQYKPNELGQIMVLMYHSIDDSGGDYSTTADEFRHDLQWLYDHDFYVIPIHDYVTNSIKAPAGKRPVILTFDDGSVSQFNYIVDSAGNKHIDPNCAIGMLEDAFTKHPDFGRGGLFSILPLAPFAWPDAVGQEKFEKEKVQFLLDHGYEIGDHTVDHIDLRTISDDEIKDELGSAVDMMHDFDSRSQMEIISVPFGEYPDHGDTTIFEGFDLNGKHYGFMGALMVGANPSPSPVDSDFDPYWIPRIRGSRDQIDKWFDFVDQNPGIMYVSDGNPDTITVPNDLAPNLDGKLDQSKLDGKTLIRY
ncbi:MAG: polysaccharide deacetylase family protein [Nitrolancea sp.]